MNLCVFAGNFVADPELTHVGANGVPITKFTLAMNRVFTTKGGEKKKEVEFLDFEAWDTGAETIAANCHKGDYIIVYTSARKHVWKDDNDQTRSRVVFRVDRFEFANVSRRSRSEPEAEQPKTKQEEAEIPF